MFQLRPYQAEGVAAIRAAYMRGRRAPLYVLPTGGGKTRVFSEIANLAVAKGHRVTILVHRFELLTQCSRALSMLGVEHGLISPSFCQTRHPVQVASVQTLVRRLDRVDAPNLIVCDEAHHALASTYRKIFQHWPRAAILGVTATPCRTNGDGLKEVFDDLIFGPSIADLISGGFLVKPTVFNPPVGADLEGVRKVRGDFDQREMSRRLDRATITGSAVQHYIRLCKGLPTIAFCSGLKHAEHVADEYRQAGIPAMRVDGNMEDSERRRAIEGLGNGTFAVLTTDSLIGEGVDIPICSAVQLLRRTDSLALYLQMVGRCLRPYPGKDKAYVLDHVGNVGSWRGDIFIERHGFPDDPRDWSLEGTRAGKRQAKDEDEVRVSQCPKCFFVYVHGPSQCPQCQHAAPPKPRTVREREGELAELKREQIIAQRSLKSKINAAQSIQELEAIAKQQGYSKGWAWHRYNINQRYAAKRKRVKA